MSDFAAGCRVRCIDATPLPINVPGSAASDFSFPGGFIEEGALYVVEGVFPPVNGRARLMLEGMPVLHCGREIPWCGSRFRPLEEEIPMQCESRASGTQSLAILS